MKIKFRDLETAIIHLKRCEERRKRVKFTPNAWVNAYDGTELTERYLNDELVSYTGHTFYVPYNKPITVKWRCKMACFLSHMKTLKQFSKPLLILEDDFLPKDKNVDITNWVLHDVPDDWDILLLGGFVKPKKGIVLDLKDGWNRLDKSKCTYYCTHSYIVKDPKKILEMVKKTIPRAYDSYLNYHVYSKVNTYFIQPTMIIQNSDFISTIDPLDKYNWLSS